MPVRQAATVMERKLRKAETAITLTQYAAIMKGPCLIIMHYYLILLHVIDMDAIVILKH